MKIGILTYHFANNYGAALQAYSIYNSIKSMGHEVEFIDYQSEKQKSNNSVYLSCKKPINILKNIARIPSAGKRKIKNKKFDEFRKKTIKICNRKISDADTLITYAENNYDALVVGSDQIWNPKAPDFEAVYFRVSKAKIPVYAYAGSLGFSNEYHLADYKQDLLKFSAISVREDASVKILKNLDKNINSVGVLDPTLIVDKEIFEKYAGKKNNEDYILCYYLGRKNIYKFKKCIESLSKKLGYKVYYINTNAGLAACGKGVLNDCGPEDFLSLIKNAKLVCTNSFHAVAISIRFKVPFYTFENTLSIDTRKRDILKRLDIEDRIINDFDISKVTSYGFRDDIDLEKRLEPYKKISLDYLNNIKGKEQG